MKRIFLALILFCAAVAANAQTAEFQREVAESNARAISIYPAAAQKGTVLNERIANIVEEKQHFDPDFFRNPDWPWLITSRCAGEILARQWALDYCASAQRNYDQIRSIYREAISNGYTKYHVQRLNMLFAEIKNSGDIADQGMRERPMMRAEDRAEFIERFSSITKQFNRDYNELHSTLATIQEKRQAQAQAEVDALTAAAAAAPKQYNGQPLPRNWIDPRQADFNFYMQGLIDSLNRRR